MSIVRPMLSVLLLGASSALCALGQISRESQVLTVAGNGTSTYLASQEGVKATLAGMSPGGIAMDDAGNTYIGDTSNNRIRRIDSMTGLITTYAGTGVAGFSGDGGQAALAKLSRPTRLVFDHLGDLYFSDEGNNRVRQIAPSGVITTIAGNGTTLYVASQDGGPGSAASLLTPKGLAVNSNNDLYIADSGHFRVRLVSGGVIRTFAGSDNHGAIFQTDGMNPAFADLGAVTDVAVGSGAGFGTAGVVVYIAGGSRVWAIPSPINLVYTYAGNGTAGPTPNGQPARSYGMDPVDSLVWNRAGYLYMGLSTGRIALIPDNTTIFASITTLAGSASTAYLSADEGVTPDFAHFHAAALAIDSLGNVVIADDTNSRIRSMGLPNGRVTFAATPMGASTTQTVLLHTGASLVLNSVKIAASQGGKQEFVLGAVTGCGAAGATVPAGTECSVPVTFTPAYPGFRSGAITVVTGAVTSKVQVTGMGIGPSLTFPPGTIRTIAGDGTRGYRAADDGGPAKSAKLGFVPMMATDVAGNLYFGDNTSHIRKVSADTGLITTIGGNGLSGFSGDGGLATSAAIGVPIGIAVNGLGDVYFSDGSNRVRKITASTGLIITVAGSGGGNYSSAEEGAQAIKATFISAGPIALDDARGLLYVWDFNYRLRRVELSTGVITTYAGNGSNSTPPANNVLATSTSTNGVSSIAVDPAGNVFYGDGASVWRVDAVTHLVKSVVGTGVPGYNAQQDGSPANAAQLYFANGLVFNAAGDLYIADNANHRIRKVTAKTGLITTIAGTGADGTKISDDGSSPLVATLSSPGSVTSDSVGNLYFSDESYYIRKISQDTAAVGFGTSVVGVKSADSPRQFTVSNIGNGPATLAAPASGSNPSLSAGFSLSNASTCPQVFSGSAAGTIAAGTECTEVVNFTPVASGAVNGGLVISAAAGAGATIATVALTGSGTPGASSVAIVTSNASVTVGATFTLTATVLPAAATGQVKFMNGAALLGTSNLVGSLATLSVNNLPAGAYALTAVYLGDANYTGSTSLAVAQGVVAVITPDYSLTVAPPSLTMQQGKTGTAVFTVTPTGGFTGTVTFSCTGLPTGAACAFAPASVTVSGPASTTTLTITTAAATASLERSSPWGQSGAVLATLLGCAGWRRRRVTRGVSLQCLVLALVLLPLAGCGGSGGSSSTSTGTGTGPAGGSSANSTPPGTYSVVVNSSASGTTHTAALTVVVTQ